MVFKDKKVPKHLIIEDEYEVRQRPRFSFFKFALLTVLMITLTYIVSVALMKI